MRMTVPPTMRAAYRDTYRGFEGLSVREIPVPAPGPGQLLVQVAATTVNRTDCAIVTGKPWVMRLVTGVLRPRLTTPGTDFAGRVALVGSGVTRFGVGDRVMGFDDMGLQSHAPYLVMPEGGPLIRTPDAWTDEQAAASCEGAHYAVNFLNKVDLQPGHRVLVYGASGAIGSALVQLCRAAGAHVTAVCTAATLDRVKALGAEEVLDHQAQDFTALPGRFQLVLDAVGKSSFPECRHLLVDRGVYISSELGDWMQNVWFSLASVASPGRRVKFPIPSDIPATLERMRVYAETGAFTPLMDRTFPLADVVEAYRYVASSQKVGNVLLSMA